MAPAPDVPRPGPPQVAPRRTLWWTTGVAGAVFLALALWVVATGLRPTVLDARMADLIAPLTASAAVRRFGFEILSVPGDTPVVGLLVAAVVVGAAVARHVRLAVATAVGTAVGMAVVYIVKPLLGRVRPFTELTVSAAFPSGHATKAALVLGLVVYAVWCFARARAAAEGRPGPGRTGARTAWTTWLGLAFLTGLGRILANVHWTTDVLAGWALGTALLALTVVLHQDPTFLPWLTDGPGLQPETGERPNRSATPAARA